MALRITMTSRTETSISIRFEGAGNPVTSAYYDIRNLVNENLGTTYEVNGSTSYYISGDGYYSVIATFSGLSPGTLYSFRGDLRPIGSHTRQVYGTFSTVASNPDPAITSLSVTSDSSISATWSVSNAEYMRSSNSMAVYMSGENNSGQYFVEYLGSSVRSWSTQFDGAGNSLVSGSSYTLWIYVYDTDNNSFGVSRTVTFTKTRPSNFSWTYSKVSGGDFNLTALEWNGLLDRINEFRVYKGLTQITTFTYASSGTQMTATMFNQAVNIINTMSPTTSPPPLQSSGNIVYASHLNLLRDSLNSIN